MPTIASAGSSPVTPPSGLRVVSVSSSSFTVASKTSAGANRYRLYASTVRSDLFVKNISAARKSPLSKTPKLRMKGLKYTAAPYYYRLEAINGARRRFSATIGAVGLQPSTPTNLQVTSGASGTWLTWDSGPATGYSIAVSTDPLMADAQVNTITGIDKQYTPYGLKSGTTYYFEVSAMNGSTSSQPTAAVSATVETSEQPVSVMTYNILEAFNDGHKEGSGVVAPWSKRVVGAVKLIKQADPDVIAIQEGAAWANESKRTRQVDSLVAHLHGKYALADTEIPPTQHHYFRTGVYVLYKTSMYKAVGAGNHWGLGNQRWAAYQVLQNVNSGAKFLMVAPHLMVGDGAKFDNERKAETKSLLSQVASFVRSDPVPVVYGGDFNSDVNRRHAFNAPNLVMAAAGIDDAYDVAQKRTNAQYNSANEYFRKPLAFGDHIDYVFAPPGVGVKSWKLMLDLSHGKFVGVIPSDHNPLVADLTIPY
jgi:endonuclease/exonuclease/phosphatase family metal-dependent hydrolase